MTLLSQRMDHHRQESTAIKGDVRSLLERFQELEERISTLEEANCEKEGRIDTLESLVDSMSDQLCHCAEKSP
jgi:predicted  nucleic acid-binding Zn-ribbon protein